MVLPYILNNHPRFLPTHPLSALFPEYCLFEKMSAIR